MNKKLKILFQKFMRSLFGGGSHSLFTYLLTVALATILAFGFALYRYHPVKDRGPIDASADNVTKTIERANLAFELAEAKKHWPGFNAPPITYAEYGALGDYFGGLINPFVALMGFIGLLATIRQQGITTKKMEAKHDDEKYIEHAVRCLERAYAELKFEGSDGVASPKQDRLAWLTCARLLLSAGQAYDRVSDDAAGLRALYEGEQEYWRRRFYSLLDMDKPYGPLKQGTFFSYWNEDFSQNAIEPRSIRVIADFASWPDGMMDPIDSVLPFTDKEIDTMNGSLRGVQQYLQTQRDARKSRHAADKNNRPP